MRKIIFVLLLLISFNSFAQKDKNKELGFYLMDINGNQVKDLDKAATYQVVIRQDDSTFIIRDYKKGGPMILQESFKDEGLSIPNGHFAWYDANGDIDSAGNATSGHKNGAWQYYTHVNYTDANGDPAIKDSIVKTQYYSFGRQVTMGEFYSEHRKDTTTDENKAAVNPVQPVSDNPREAAFPGGVDKWVNYLKKNLDISVGKLIPQYNNLKNGLAPVLVSFLVEKDGSVGEVFIEHSSGYPFDKEAVRVIEDSGNWIPAQQFGKNVTYRQKQRIIFRK